MIDGSVAGATASPLAHYGFRVLPQRLVGIGHGRDQRTLVEIVEGRLRGRDRSRIAACGRPVDEPEARMILSEPLFHGIPQGCEEGLACRVEHDRLSPPAPAYAHEHRR